MGVLWEGSFLVFFFLTVVIGGGAAYMTGRSLAEKWRSPIQPVLYTLLLVAAVRFFHFALFEGALLSLQYFVVDAIVLIAISLIGYRLMRVGQMVSQYPWLYVRNGPLAWRDK